jgi:hypothetical protein
MYAVPLSPRSALIPHTFAPSSTHTVQMMQSKPAYALITHNLTPFIVMENHYSMMYREEEHDRALCKTADFEHVF